MRPCDVDGRPDLRDRSFGVTQLKRFPPFVYSILGGMLVHQVAAVEAHWYDPQGTWLRRRDAPWYSIRAACGQTFLAGRTRRVQACVLPKPDAVRCGRCAGTGAVFGRGLAERKVRRSDARARIGCAMEAS